jgi:simple sugar transport system ATP-binding protein
VGEKQVVFASPRDAIAHGIGAVYQHFTLVPPLSITENVILGRGGSAVLDLRRAAEEIRASLEAFELSLDPHTPVKFLSLGQQQRVEIIKALSRGSRVLLLDEPTSILTPTEASELFRIVGRLKGDGVGVVFITHKLEEALQISDRITILRKGQRAGELGPEEIRADRAAAGRRIVDLMFGGQPPADTAGGETAPAAAEEVLTLDRVTVRDDRGVPAVQEVSLSLYPGEILGIAGVDGNGQKELAEAIAGQRRVTAGRIRVEGRDITNRGTPTAVRAGIGYATDDRIDEGTIRQMTVAENLILRQIDEPRFGRAAFLDWGAIQQYAEEMIIEHGIVTRSPAARVGTLSGGNVQKLLLARELSRAPRVLICSQPTHGLDVFTATRVLAMLRQQAGAGMAVVLISSDLDEVLEMSHRVGVMYGGRLVRVVSRNEADRESIGRLMLGLAS